MKRIKPLAWILAVVALLCYWLWSASRNYGFVSAAGSGNIAKVRACLDEGFDPNLRAFPGSVTAMQMAIAGHNKGHKMEVVRLLLDRGAEPTIALGLAISSGQEDIVRLLIARGADVNVKVGSNQSALEMAQEQGDNKIIRLLKSAGARKQGMTGTP